MYLIFTGVDWKIKMVNLKDPSSRIFTDFLIIFDNFHSCNIFNIKWHVSSFQEVYIEDLYLYFYLRIEVKIRFSTAFSTKSLDSITNTDKCDNLIPKILHEQSHLLCSSHVRVYARGIAVSKNAFTSRTGRKQSRIFSRF